MGAAYPMFICNDSVYIIPCFLSLPTDTCVAADQSAVAKTLSMNCF